MVVRLLEEREDLLIIQDSDGVSTVPITPYHILKYKHFDGNRIIYKLNEDMEIVETFNNGIFNIRIKEEWLQFREPDRIANIITKHRESGSTEEFEEYFKREYADKYNLELIQDFVKCFGDRVKIKDHAFVVDGMFKVDDSGEAHVKLGNKTWKRVCIVAHEGKNIKLHSTMVNSPVGTVKLDSKGLTIISKIGFLLNPNLNDKTFLDQLPKKVHEILMRNKVIPVEETLKESS